jgi:hypothetical protein
MAARVTYAIILPVINACDILSEIAEYTRKGI